MERHRETRGKTKNTEFQVRVTSAIRGATIRRVIEGEGKEHESVVAGGAKQRSMTCVGSQVTSVTNQIHWHQASQRHLSYFQETNGNAVISANLLQ